MLVRDLIEKLRRFDPETPVVACSSLEYSGEATISRLVPAFFKGQLGCLGTIHREDSRVLDAMAVPESIHKVVFLETDA
jgi:hypothetical protein